MPTRAPVFEPPGFRSSQERKAEQDKARLGVRLRGRAAVNRRAMWLTMHPLCEHCMQQDRITAATEVDHRVPRFSGGADDETNLQSLCHACHVIKTNDERSARTHAG